MFLKIFYLQSWVIYKSDLVISAAETIVGNAQNLTHSKLEKRQYLPYNLSNKGVKHTVV